MVNLLKNLFPLGFERSVVFLLEVISALTLLTCNNIFWKPPVSVGGWVIAFLHPTLVSFLGVSCLLFCVALFSFDVTFGQRHDLFQRLRLFFAKDSLSSPYLRPFYKAQMNSSCLGLVTLMVTLLNRTRYSWRCLLGPWWMLKMLVEETLRCLQEANWRMCLCVMSW